MKFFKSKIFIFTLVFLGISFVQFIIFPTIFRNLIMPNLLLLSIVVISFHYDYIVGMFYALFGGMLIDNSDNLFFGSSSLIFLLIIFSIFIIKRFNNPNLLMMILFIIIFTVIYNFFSVIFSSVFVVKINTYNEMRFALINVIENVLIFLVCSKFIKFQNIKKKKYV